MKKSMLLLMIVAIILSVCSCSASSTKSNKNRYHFRLGTKTESYTLSEIEEMRTSDGRKYQELNDKSVSGSGTIRIVSPPRETNWDVDPITGEETPIGWEVLIELDDGMKITYRPNSPDEVSLYAGDKISFQGKTFPRAEEILIWPELNDSYSHFLKVQ